MGEIASSYAQKKGNQLSTRLTSLRRSFIHTIEGHHEVIRGAQRFQGAVLDSIERLATRCALRHPALAENLQFHQHHTGTYHVNRARGANGKVDDAARDEWPTIVDPHLHCLPIRLVLDRKSTRLNSSHLGISYAVFCLKKTNT